MFGLPSLKLCNNMYLTKFYTTLPDWLPTADWRTYKEKKQKDTTTTQCIADEILEIPELGRTYS